MIKTGIKLGLSGLLSIYEKCLDLGDYGYDVLSDLVNEPDNDLKETKPLIAHIPLLGKFSAFNPMELDLRSRKGEPYVPDQFIDITEQYFQFLVDRANADGASGFLFEIYSPGGQIYPAKRIAEIITNEIKLPKIAYIRGDACSGGYLVASSCDYIVSHETCTQANISVIMSHEYYAHHRDGLTNDTISTGDKKDFNNPLKPNSKEEKKMLMKIAKQFHKQFIEFVAEHRGISMKKMKKIADGSMYHSLDAKRLGLIDMIGQKEDAIRYLENIIGQESEVIKYSLRFKENPSSCEED
ncbi:S49 family peptidase [Candidatus Woesearchaeota archaeon]|nr:S49 family peptidase [Candidatus Woesearchaeota archaeon]